MGRFGPLTARFYLPSNLTAPINVGGVTTKVAKAGSSDDYRDAEGGTTLVFTNDTALATFAAVGNICWAYKTDSVRDDLAGGVTFAEPFIIRSRVVGPAADEVTIGGPDLLTEMRRWTIYRPLGALVTTATTLAAEGTGPVARTLAANAVAGTDTITPNATSEEDFDKEIRVTLNGGAVHITVIKAITNDMTTYVLRDRLPTAANSGNALSLRKRLVRVTNPAPFQQGVEVTVTLNSGSHATVAAAGITDGDRVTLRDALPSLANIGNAITAGDYSGRSTNDVTAVMAYAQEGWAAEFETGTGTAMGTRYPGGGDTVYDILRAISDETGELFRLKSAEAGTPGPKRTVVWRRTHDTAGVGGTLRLVRPTDATMAAETANKNRAILIARPRHAGEYDPVTQVIPVAGDSHVTLFGCSAAAVAQAATDGYAVVTTGLGLYAAPYVQNTALNTSIGVHQRKVSFSEVTVEGDNTAAITAACDRLLALSIAYLKAHVTTSKDIEAVCISPVGIRPGQKVELLYDSPTGEYTLDYTGGWYLYVQAVRREVSPDGEYPGAPITTLSLSPATTRAAMSAPRPPIGNKPGPDNSLPRLSGGRTIGREIGRRLKQLEQTAMRNNAPQLVYQSVSSGAGTGGGTTGGDVTGAYLPLAGGTMTGNISFSGAQTVDGVDISAHAANASAHHNPVTAADGSITVSTQTIRIADAAAGAGLSLSAGVLGVQVSTALGTLISSDVVGVAAQSTGGLQVGASGVKVLLPANSGLVSDSTGLYLSPSTLTAATTNAVATSGHTHAITATENANTTTSTLLKGSAVGYLTLAGLGVGDTATSAAAVYARAKAVDDYTLYLKQLSGQTASILRVEATAGHALILLTGEGDLESGNPGFVSGMTGWQIESTGNAEFNNVSVRGELHAVTFVADEMHATGGTLAVMTATTVADPVGANDNKLPVVGSTFILNVTASYNTSLNYFTAGDIIRIKHMGKVTSGAALDLYDIYLQVQSGGTLTGNDLTEGEPGYYPMTCYRRNGGADNLVIPAGAAVVKWGKISGGAGTYTGGIILTSDMAQSPYIDIFTIDANQLGTTWQTAPVTPTPRVRVGNLDGVLGLAEQWGIAMGTDLSDTALNAPSIVASNLGLNLRNVDLKMYNGSTPTALLSSVGALRLGTDTGSIATITFDFSPVDGSLRVGPFVNGKPFMNWDGTELGLYQRAAGVTTPIIVLNSSGASYFAGPMTISTAGGIYQGTGTFASPTAGLKIHNASGQGRLSTFVGGAERLRVDDSGTTIFYAAAKSTASGVMAHSGGSIKGGLYFYASGGAADVLLETTEGANTSSIKLTGGTSKRDIELAAGTTKMSISSAFDFVLIETADLYIKERGLAIGYTATPSMNRGQIACDFAGEHDFNAIVLQDTVDVAHGMSTIVGSTTYGAFGKVNNANGGLYITGATEGQVGTVAAGYVTTANTAKSTAALAPVAADGFLKSGTGVVNMSANGNLFVVRGGTPGSELTRFIVDSEGDIHIDGTSNTYDSFNDVHLIRAADLALAGHDIDREYGHWLEYNRADLERLGLISAGGFVNVTRMQRVMTGAIWQSYERISAIEKRLGEAGL